MARPASPTDRTPAVTGGAGPHPYPPTGGFGGGDLDCGNGLLMLIRKHIDPLDPGQLLEILSVESSVEEDLPAWCRLTGNELVNMWRDGDRRSFLVSKGAFVTPPKPVPAAEAIATAAGPSPPSAPAAGTSLQ